MSQIDQKAIIRAALFTPGVKKRWGLPLILWGDPGVAKSSVLEGIAMEMGLGFNSTIMSICEPADLAGYPMPNEEKTMIRPLPPVWIHNVNDMEGALQVFDEATSTNGAAHAAMMRITLDGKAGDLDVNKRVRFMMAANPVEVAANAHELAIPLANRFGHIEFNPGTAQDWVDWLLSGEEEIVCEKPAAQREAEVLEQWDGAFSDAKGLVASFIIERSSLLHKMPDVDAAESSLAWPSRRTWEFATRALAGARVHNLTEAETGAFMAAYIGQGAASEFINYMENMDLPKASDLLNGRAKFKHSAKRMDKTLAVLSSCATFLITEGCDENTTKKARAEFGGRLTKYWEIAQSVVNVRAGELVVPSAKLLVKRHWDCRFYDDAIVADEPVFDVMSKISPMVSKVVQARRT